MASPPGRQEVVPSRKKARRSSRQGEAPSPSHYGPVACTSAASALVQAYLAIDISASSSTANPQQQSNGTGTATGGGSSGSNGKAKGALRAASDSCFLYMSESTFDPVKRRFGGKSKPVMLPNGSAASAAAAAAAAASAGGSVTAVGEGGTAAVASGGSSSSSKGVRLSFSQGTKIVTTKEAMHTSLHCRCVFVLLCELSSPDGGGVSSTSRGNSKRVDTAHLVALSPHDLFCALSVESFPLSVFSAARGTSTDGGGGNGRSSSGRLRQQQPPLATGTLPRAFEVADGPVVIHRPAARLGEPWRGLEVFRREGGTGPWRGRPVPVTAGGGSRGKEVSDVDDGDRLANILGGGDGGNRGATGLRLDLSAAAAAAAAAADGHGGFLDLSPPLSGGSSAGRPKKRSSGAGNNALLVCAPGASYSQAGRGPTTTLFGDTLGTTGTGSTGVDAAAVVVVPATAASAPAAAGTEAEDAPPSPFRWMSLSIDHDGETSLEPWCGVPSESRNPPTCICRGPDVDSGVVGLAPGGAAGGEGGLLLRSLPPTMYIGVAFGGSRSRVETTAEAAVGARTRGTGGALLELRRGALSCHRLLPAPPAEVVAAAVDDAQGVVALLLDDQDQTALLLARDGSDLAVVEEHRGISAIFKGDFLGNGREQVALLSPAVASGGGGGGSGGGGGKAGKRGAAVAAKAGASGWEQLPLKALVKRALVTDCSCVWGNERRDVALSPSAGVTGAGSPTVEVSQQSSKESPKGKKRQRPEKVGDDATAGAGKAGSGPNGSPGAAAVGSSERRPIEGAEGGHRLSNLSNVVGVLRRRVRAEEARLLQLRQARRSKAAALEAAKRALVSCVGGSAGGDDSGRDWNDDDDSDASEEPTKSIVPRTFFEGLVAPGSGVSDTAPSPIWTGERSSEAPLPAPPRCEVARVRFHAPSRALCLDAHVSNPPPCTEGDRRAPSATVVNVCLAVASASGRLSTRSAVCPRLRPGESATVRACVDVPLDLLAVGVGGAGGAASLYASCTWSLAGDGAAENDAGAGRQPAAAALSPGARESVGALHPSSSLIFSRILVSSQDMLGIVGSGLSSAAHAPETTKGTGPYHPPKTAGSGEKNGAGSTSSNGVGGGNGARSRPSIGRRQRYLGLFDVGNRVDLLLWSDPATPSASLATLPQAVRSLSDMAALPEPWAGGAAVQVNECSERAAECTLRAGDSASAPTVLMTVAAGALPDGARASADHASEQGQALVAAAAGALRDEIAALELVARERSRLNGGAGKKNGDGGGAGAAQRLSEALERYGAAQMKSDVLAARLAGRVVAAQSGAL